MSEIIYNNSSNISSFARTNNSKLTAFNANDVDENNIAQNKAANFIDAFGRLVDHNDHSAMAEAARVRAESFMTALNAYQARA